MTRTRVLRAATVALVGALAAAGSLTAPATAILGAQAAPAEESAFAAAVNNIRTVRGLAPLQLNGELNGIARSWSFTMAAAGQISHRPDLRAGVTSAWSSLGENVGVGQNVDDLMTAFVNSPGHYKNLVEPKFTHMGIGAVTVGGVIFTTHLFMTLDSPGAPAIGSTLAPVVTPPVRSQTTAPRAPAPTAPPRRAVAAPAPVAAPKPTAPAPPPAPAAKASPDRVLDVLDQIRGNPPTF